MCALCTCDTLPCWPILFYPTYSQMKADANYQANAAKGLQLILSRRKVWPGDRGKTERLWKMWIPGCLRNIDRSGSLHPMHLAFPFPWPPFISLRGLASWTNICIGQKKVILRVEKIEKHRNMWPSSIVKGISRVWQAKKTSGCERRK